jgi:hypothetical protein
VPEALKAAVTVLLPPGITPPTSEWVDDCLRRASGGVAKCLAFIPDHRAFLLSLPRFLPGKRLRELLTSAGLTPSVVREVGELRMIEGTATDLLGIAEGSVKEASIALVDSLGAEASPVTMYEIQRNLREAVGSDEARCVTHFDVLLPRHFHQEGVISGVYASYLPSKPTVVVKELSATSNLLNVIGGLLGGSHGLREE